MKRLLPALLLALVAAPAFAQHQGHGAAEPRPEEQESADTHAGHEMGAMQQSAPGGGAPPAAFSGPAHAADLLFDPQVMAGARAQLRAEQGGLRTSMLLADRFEAQSGDGDESYLWDIQGSYGGDINRFWLKSEGEGDIADRPDHAELQLLYSRAISPYFNMQAGLRHDFRPDPERSHLVLGVQGLAPYAFGMDAAVFLSDEGDLTGRIEGELDLQITQRFLLQPRLELNLAAQDIPELGIGSGFASVEAGLRLRYEIRREVAPYFGVGWERTLGDTADLARAAGEDDGGWRFVFGVRSWF